MKQEKIPFKVGSRSGDGGGGRGGENDCRTRTEGRKGGRTDGRTWTEGPSQGRSPNEPRGGEGEGRRSGARSWRQQPADNEPSLPAAFYLRCGQKSETPRHTHALRSTALHSTALHSDALLILRRSLAALQNEILLMRTQLYRIAAEEAKKASEEQTVPEPKILLVQTD